MNWKKRGKRKVFKKAVAVCSAFLLIIFASAAGASGLFPSTNEMFGKAMPSVGMAIGRTADEISESEDALAETYLHFGAKEYMTFGRYLAGIGASVQQSEITDTEIRVTLSAREAEMSLTYNWKEQKGTAFYPAGTRPEREKAEEEGQDSLLPQVGGILPSATFAISREPDEVRNENGGTKQVYSAFSDEDYSSFSLYLGQSGAAIQSSTNESGVLEAEIELRGAAFSFVYDWNRQTASCFYPQGTIPEICRCAAGGKSKGLLPQIDSIGEVLPSLSLAINRQPDSVKAPKDGSIRETYGDFDDEDYDIFSEYLSKKNCKTAEFQIQNESVLLIQLSNRSGKMSFTYDALNHEAQIIYPAFSRVEKIWPVTVPEVNRGDILTFGHYEQDNNLNNGQEPIEWIVLDYDEAEHRALLLSRYGLDAKPYHDKPDNITWEGCTLRSWLNDDFLRTAFTAEEQGALLKTKVDNSKGQGGLGGDGGNDTEDLLFLLSDREVFEEYFSDNDSRTCRLTDYAKEQGAKTDPKGAGWWWLRSPGRNQFRAEGVSLGGSRTDRSVNLASCCVRPAFWLNLDAGIFESKQADFEVIDSIWTLNEGRR